jgi:orotidine-5'-phosphate decarboxylase
MAVETDLHPMRDRFALALDVDDVVAATRLANELRPWFGVAKIGLELYSAAGPDAVLSVIDAGYKVFLDLKLHDIPTTVNKACRVLGALGVSYVSMHGSGGALMLRAGIEGLSDGASNAGLDIPKALAVTVLTSDMLVEAHVLTQRVKAALEAHCPGVVCAASDVREVKQLGPSLITVVPGIRPAGSPLHDQHRAATPAEAFANGADLLVIGRAVTSAPDHAAAASSLLESIGS